ncbi:MAG: hypothetical protein R3C02_02565 [Planctomycetaceae bacterium]
MQAASFQMRVGAALMPDAHVGYGLPHRRSSRVGKCGLPVCGRSRHRVPNELSVLDMPAESLDNLEMFHVFRKALEGNRLERARHMLSGRSMGQRM